MSPNTPPRLTPDALMAMVGQEIGISRWVTIDQARIDAFANVTEDHQFIHIDPAAAAKTPFGTTIAHGFLTLSMLSTLADGTLPRVAGRVMGINYGFERVRFIAPVPSGAQIRGRFTLADAQFRREGEFQLRYKVVVEIESGEKPALVADWLTLSVLADPALRSAP